MGDYSFEELGALAERNDARRDAERLRALINDGVPVWYHEPCGHVNIGVWHDGKFCGGCRFEVRHAQHVNHYVMVKVTGSNPDPAAADHD